MTLMRIYSMRTTSVVYDLIAMALFSIIAYAGGVAWAEVPDQQETFDILIRGGRIVDGTGAPWYYGDLGIREGRIAAIGRLDRDAARETIDATGLVVAPGFIDMMGQTASPMIDDSTTAVNLLTQGITTINAGEGSSAAPLSHEEELRQGWSTMAEYFALLEMNGLPVNMTQTVGHTQVRSLVLGDAERRPGPKELAQMQALVNEGMEAGAIGVSTALIYPPAVYAQTEEISALVQIAGRHGGRYYTHMRNEGDRLLEAMDEAFEIGREGNASVHIFHLKAAGRNNWSKMPLALAKIKQARAGGFQVTADIYPYVNNGLGISALIHPRHFSEGFAKFLTRIDEPEYRLEIRREIETTDGWENWYRHAGSDWSRIVIGSSNTTKYANLNGQSLQEIALATGEDPWDVFFELVRARAFALPETMSEANKTMAMQEPFISFCTDVGPAGTASFASHPRAFGSFPRLLSRYVREWGSLSLERAVAQASATAANHVMAYNRGRLAPGLAADVIVFDPEAIADRANFANPRAHAVGMHHVIVNGEFVWKDGEYTGARPGRVLRGPGYRRETGPENLVTGDAEARFAPFDRRLSEFIRKHRVPGVAVAMTENGQLVFARGYGYADLATRERVKPTSLFRIASISKPVTAVAVLQLVEQQKLSLDAKVFDVLDYQAEMEQLGDQFDGRLRDVTIRHLLEHRGGWDRDASFDAMFQSVRFARKLDVPPPADQQTVIRAMLAQPLDFAPGERYAYSNFGYCLLGRVIEQLTGTSYEAYVKEHVLAPLGIDAMRIGATRLDGRADGEVRYYQPGSGESVFAEDLGQMVPWPYGGWYLEAMDSHGGWIASAVDLAKFAAAFDDVDQCPVLTRESIELMHGRPPGLAGYDENNQPKDVYYSLGWMNRMVGEDQANHWHTGSLSGTATILIRRHDGINLVALINTRVSPTSSHLGREIETLLDSAANESR